MDAIKKVLAPGKSKDDEIMYGDRSNAGVSDAGKGQYTQGVPQGDAAPTLHTLPEGEDKKSHGILKQIFNPGGDKYDEQKFSSTATTDASAVSPQTTNDKSDNGISRQILNPRGEKYDETRFGSSSEPAKSSSVAGGPISGTTASGTTATQPSHTTTTATSSSAVPSTGAYTQGDSTTSQPSHLGRDAAIGGAGAAGAGSLAYEVGKHRHQHDPKPVGTTAGTAGTTSTDAERAFPLAGGAAATSQDIRPPQSAASSNYSQPTSGAHDFASTGGAVAPTRATESSYTRPADNTATTGPSTTSAHAPHDHRGAETAALGGATALGAGGVAAHEHNKHSHQPHTAGQYDSSSTASQGLSHHVHNDGSAPTTGSHSHEHRFAPAAGAVGGAAALGAGDAAAHDHQKQHTGLSYHDPSATEGGLSHHVYNGVSGKNGTTEATGATAPGLATSTGPSSSTRDPATTTTAPFGSANDRTTTAAAPTRSLNEPTIPITGSSAHEQRPAGGFAAGAGAAGLAAAGLTKHEHDQHSSEAPHIPGEFPSDQPTQSLDRSGFAAPASGSAAEIAAQEATKRHGGPSAASGTTTSSPSDVRGLANQEVGQTPHAQQQGSDHHYARDAGIVGGVGAVGAGTYAATKHHDHKDPTSTGVASTTAAAPQQTTSHHPVRDTAAASGVGAGAYETQKHYGHKDPSSVTDSGEPQKQSLLSKLNPLKKNDSAAAEEKAEKKEHHPARDTAIAGGVGTTAYEAQKHHGHKEPSSTTATSTEPHQKESLLSKLDPRKKSDSAATEEKTERKADPKEHHTARDAAIAGGVGTAGLAGYETEKHHKADKAPSHAADSTSATEPEQKQSLLSKLDPRKKSEHEPGQEHAKGSDIKEHHVARETGVFGGIGAAGLAGYETEKHYDSAKTPSNPPPEQLSSGPTSRTTGLQGSQTSHSNHGQHHHGGAAAASAVPGSAAAASYGTPKQDNTLHTASGPASNTLGPHDSNIANIVDPRVQPDPEYQKKHNTAGPHQSDTLNKLDPRITADPWKVSKQQEKEQHDPRGAAGTGTAVAGTAVAGGAGTAAYEHEKHHGEKEHSAKHHEESQHDDKHHHNKLHKDPPSEKKEGFLHKLLHPGKKDKHDESEVSSSGAAVPGHGQHGEGVVTDPHTGLPINVDKYGSGAGGTDATQPIAGYHQGGEGESHASDWQEIKKANTPY